jgi:PhnB protein
MGSDTGSGPYLAPQGIHVSLHVDTPDEAERIYAGLSEGGSIIMPLGETFWASRFAMFSDRFGTPWMINCEQDS